MYIHVHACKAAVDDEEIIRSMQSLKVKVHRIREAVLALEQATNNSWRGQTAQCSLNSALSWSAGHTHTTQELWTIIIANVICLPQTQTPAATQGGNTHMYM